MDEFDPSAFLGDGPEDVIPMQKPASVGRGEDEAAARNVNADADELSFSGVGPENPGLPASESASGAAAAQAAVSTEGTRVGGSDHDGTGRLEDEFHGAGPEAVLAAEPRVWPAADSSEAPAVAGASFEVRCAEAPPPLPMDCAPLWPARRLRRHRGCVVSQLSLSLPQQDKAVHASNITALVLIVCIVLSWVRFRQAISYIFAPLSSTADTTPPAEARAAGDLINGNALLAAAVPENRTPFLFMSISDCLHSSIPAPFASGQTRIGRWITRKKTEVMRTCAVYALLLFGRPRTLLPAVTQMGILG